MSEKRVLILAYDFPPYVSVGALRPYSWYKYFHEFGVHPVIVTRQWNNKFGNQMDYVSRGYSDKEEYEQTEKGVIIRVPYKPNIANKLMLRYGPKKYKLIRRAVTAYFEIMQYLFCIGPKSPVFSAAKKYLETNHVDLIIATGEPYVLFKYAAKLSKKFSVPWIADYRDPWSQERVIGKNRFKLYWHRMVEKRIVKTASSITTVAVFFKKLISETHKQIPIKVVANGFEAAMPANTTFNEHSSVHQCLRIALAGYVYPWHPWKHFLDTINDFRAENRDCELCLNLYGVNLNEEIVKYIQDKCPELQDGIKVSPKIPNEQLQIALQQDHLMLLFNYYSFPGTKIYDYLQTQRNILLCFTDDLEAEKLRCQYYPYKETGGLHPQEDIINETQSGWCIKDGEELKLKLKSLFSELGMNGEIICRTHGIERYSRKMQTQIMVNWIYDTLKLGKN